MNQALLETRLCSADAGLGAQSGIACVHTFHNSLLFFYPLEKNKSLPPLHLFTRVP